MQVQGLRAYNGTARFTLWPDFPSLTPVHKDIDWPTAWSIMAKDLGRSPEAELRAALAIYDEEVRSD